MKFPEYEKTNNQYKVALLIDNFSKALLRLLRPQFLTHLKINLEEKSGRNMQKYLATV